MPAARAESAPAPRLSEARRILVVRTSALGDIVHALPVLTALRRHLPAARLGWVVETGLAPLLDDHPLVDDLLPFDSRGWRRHPWRAETWSGAERFRRRLEAFGADVVLDLMGNHKSGWIAALSGADRRIGIARRWRRERSSAIWISEPVQPRGEHAVDQGLSLLDTLGLPREAADFGGQHLLREPPPEARALLESVPEPFAVILPGAGWANKRYPPALWGEVARRLGRRPGVATWAVFGPGEEALGNAVAAASGGAARPVAAPRLDTLAALLRGARLVLGGDTGPLHLAHALGTPVLCLMGPTDPQRTGPYGAADRALWIRLPCSFCHNRLDGPRACLLQLTPEAVARRAAELLG